MCQSRTNMNEHELFSRWAPGWLAAASQVSCVVYSANGAYLASGSLDGTAGRLESQLVAKAARANQMDSNHGHEMVTLGCKEYRNFRWVCLPVSKRCQAQVRVWNLQVHVASVASRPLFDQI